MQTFVIRRERTWETPEQLEATAQRSKVVAADEFPDAISWIRSYVIAEPYGTRRSPRSYSPPPLRPPPRGSGSQVRRRPGSSRRGSADVDLDRVAGGDVGPWRSQPRARTAPGPPKKGEVTMTAMHSRSRRAPAFGRRLRITIAALVLSALGLAAASPSQAATGSVYYDSSDNVGAGAAPFGGGGAPGCCNVGVGFFVFPSLVSGANNTAIGEATLRDNSSGSRNTASGSTALLNNESGSDNVAIGDQALLVNTTGANNVGNGSQALMNASGSWNIALGSGAGLNLTTGSNNIDIGNAGKAGESKVMRLGAKGEQTRTYIAGISGRTVNGAAQPVVVNAQGQLGTATAAAPATASAADPLSAADGQRLLDLVKRQQREIDRLREQVKGG